MSYAWVKKLFCFCASWVFLSGAVFLWSAPALAQRAVVADFSGKKGPAAKAAAASRQKVLQVLDKQGVTVISYKQYKQQAAKLRFKGAKALSPAAIAKVCAKMNLQAVVTGNAAAKGKKITLTIKVFDAQGKLSANKSFVVGAAGISAEQAGEVAGAIGGGGGGGEQVAASSSSYTPPPDEPVAEEPPAETSSDSTIVELPAWAKADGQPQAGALPQMGATAPAATSGFESGGQTAGVTAEALPTKTKKLTGCVADVLLDAGMSGNLRAGLSPRHESGFYPGVRVDARAFLGSFLDVPVVKDIGLGGLFHMGLAIKYGLQDSDEKWNSSMMQWQGELAYRLTFNEARLKPAFVLRVGYGSTVNTIDTENSAALSVAYAYPYSSLDIYLMLWDPYIRLLISGGYLFVVSGSKDISGSGNGFTVRGGLDVVILEQLYAGLGYEMFQFLGLSRAGTSVSDTFQSMFLRVGWNFN